MPTFWSLFAGLRPAKTLLAKSWMVSRQTGADRFARVEDSCLVEKEIRTVGPSRKVTALSRGTSV